MIDDTKVPGLGDNVSGIVSQDFGKDYLQYLFLSLGRCW